MKSPCNGIGRKTSVLHGHHDPIMNFQVFSTDFPR